jgi:hypothetical protein
MQRDDGMMMSKNNKNNIILTKNITTRHPLEKLHPKVPRKKKRCELKKFNQR